MGSFSEFRNLLIAALAILVLAFGGWAWASQVAATTQNTKDIVDLKIIVERLTTLVEMEKQRERNSNTLPVPTVSRSPN